MKTRAAQCLGQGVCVVGWIRLIGGKKDDDPNPWVAGYQEQASKSFCAWERFTRAW